MRVYIPSTKKESGFSLYCYDSNREILNLNTPDALFAVTCSYCGEEIRRSGVPNDYKTGYDSRYKKGELRWPINVKVIAERKRFANYVMEYLFQYGIRVFNGFIIAADREEEFMSLKPRKANAMKCTALSVCQPRVAKIGSMINTYIAWFGVRRFSDGTYIDGDKGLHVDRKEIFVRDSKRVFAKDSDKIISKYNIAAKGCLAVISAECAIEVKVTRPEIMWGSFDEIEKEIKDLIVEHLNDEGYVTSDNEPTEKFKSLTI